MPRIGSNTFIRLQNDPSCIRNICIVAHVDHGKTSLSDSLLASNGIISQRLAGKVRYLDSRPDEQLRGITMESSAISLYFRVLHKQENSDEPLVNEHLINLIDSPGHIDFSSEVSAASRLCDGAVVLVDVVEGVCSQTVTVLRQCWTEKLKPILILNKIDRLITELQLSPQEIYTHLSKVIEQVNSVIGSFFAGQRQLADQLWREELEQNTDAKYVENDDSDIYFNPVNGNVIFASATDGWGFGIGQMAKFYEDKLKTSRENLQKVLWGDYYMDPKTKKIIGPKGLKGRSLKPLFVSLIMDNIRKIYEHVLISKNEEMITKVTNVLNIKISSRDMRSKDDKQLLRTIMGQWLPVSTAVLLTVIEKLPSPLESQKERLDVVIGESLNVDKVNSSLLEAMRNCDRDGPLSAYVSKIISIPKEELPIPKTGGILAEEVIERSRRIREKSLEAVKQADALEAFSNRDDDLYTRVKETTTTTTTTTTGKNEIPSSSTDRESENTVKIVDNFAPELDLGFEYEEEPHLTPQFDLAALDHTDPLNAMFEYEEEDPFATNATQEVKQEEIEEQYDDNEVLIGFARIYSGSLKVGQSISVLGPRYDPKKPDEHVETAEITDLYLFMGKELVPLDVCPSGNIVGIGGLAGKILKNGTLVESGIAGINLAGVNLQSQPIVRVAVEPINPMQMGKLVHGLKLLNLADPCVQTYVEDTGEHILCTAGELHLERCLKDLRERFAGIEITSSEPAIPYRETFLSVPDLNPAKNPMWGRGVQKIALGPYSIELEARPLPEEVTEFLNKHEKDIKNVIEGRINTAEGPSFSKATILDKLKKLFEAETPGNHDFPALVINEIVALGPKRVGPNILCCKNDLLESFWSSKPGKFEYSASVLNGFQLAMNEGPLSKEPVQGMFVLIRDIHEMTQEEVDEIRNESYQRDVADISGRLITSTRDAIHEAFLDWSPRMMWAMYSCDIQASVDVLGKVYAVVQQRRGRITSEEMKEGTPFFQIEAHIPVIEAFGLSEDIRKRTSGAAQPQLVFAGFECIDMDPFWVPKTEEELEELGETADKENIARRHMNAIRRRKGLFVDEKVIQNAEKQRTLKRN